MNTWHLKQAVRILRHGGVIAYPTEAVWGLGCDPWDRDAVMRILAIKKRPVEKGLILVASDLDQLGPLVANLSCSERLLLEQKSNHPTTWIIPDESNFIPYWIKGLHQEVAVRVSDHSGVKRLCRHYDGMLVSTSANLAGQPEATNQHQLRSMLGRSFDYLLPGTLGGFNRPSEIKVLRSGQTLRS
ncbi:MAG: L-threonylcarbamoyladenylate synthase [Motiliproteus sp.]|nr:L-threonylcarbamoyladenylate synthase [Motiliproteus sp.]MCW9052449.1 L-threonylcarbamoyladenylate synthase [Motiliproteus sp.]